MEYDGSAPGRILSVGHGTTKDGPNWRSIVYLMGCNFKCPWCSSPHTVAIGPNLLIHANLEKYPERISRSCLRGAISVAGGKTNTDRSVCVDCVSLNCVRFCIDGSREAVGQEVTVDEVISEILEYRRFHKEYGVTISGGEPTCQWNFFVALLKGLKAYGIHAAVETNGSSPMLPKALPWLDLVICDLKHMDDAKHRELTGLSNQVVLNNIRYIADTRHALWVRIPIVPGLNDGDNLERSAEFLESLDGNLRVEILGYHRLGAHNWKALGLPYECGDIVPPAEGEIEEMRDVFRRHGIDVIVT